MMAGAWLRSIRNWRRRRSRRRSSIGAAAIEAHRAAPPDAGFSARLTALAQAALEEAQVCREADEAGFEWPPHRGANSEPPYELRPGSGRRGPDGAMATLRPRRRRARPRRDRPRPAGRRPRLPGARRGHRASSRPRSRPRIAPAGCCPRAAGRARPAARRSQRRTAPAARRTRTSGIPRHRRPLVQTLTPPFVAGVEDHHRAPARARYNVRSLRGLSPLGRQREGAVGIVVPQ